MSLDERSHQLPLALGGDNTARHVKTTPRANKRSRSLTVLQPSLPTPDRSFQPVAGVPKTRGDCPDTSSCVCPHVRCRWHLMLETAEHRAGRPGLKSVKRDARGWTIAQRGDAGDERPGTTLRPGWLKVRGLEIEREVKVYLSRDGDSYMMHEVKAGTVDYWLRFLRQGELVLVFPDNGEAYDSGRVEPLARARLTVGNGLVLDRHVSDEFVTSCDAVILSRGRQIDSCALDVIARDGKLGNEEAGNAVARHRTLVAREIKHALRKACERAEEMGMDAEDFVASLMRMGNAT